MMLKLRKFTQLFGAGLVTGTTAHLVAYIALFSSERLAHFVGHVVAVILLRLLY